SVIALQKNDIAPEQLSKALHAVAACKAGVPRIHIINGRVDEGLLAEVFSNEGIGTLIYANDYQQIRRAMKKDVRAIQLLTKAAVESEELVKRTRAAIEKTLGDYFIFEIDKNPVACVALHVYPEQKQGAGDEPDRTDHALDAGVHVFSVQGRVCRGHARRFAARAPRKIRAKRKK